MSASTLPEAVGGPIVRIAGLTVRYGARVALNDFSLTVDDGVVGLLGPNGAGKSTLLKTLLGFCKAASGSAQVFGMPVERDPLEIRRRVGYMPERDVSSPKLSAVSFVAYCGCLAGMAYKDALQRTHEVLNYVGFGEERYRRMETYSTGMRQRAKLAQALVHDPELLFLDEPTNGLDPIGRIAMLELIREVARTRRMAVLLSSHLLPDVEHVCQRVALLDQGKLIREGDIAALTQFKSRLWRVRVKERGESFAAVLRASGFTTEREEDGALLVHQPEGAAPADVFRAARDHEIQIRHFEPVRHRLEEAFLLAVSGGG
ncbi:MAG: ABC transporter ATP-binding protein [Candidatus Hydrogenedentes bacterium]|nr:ABC transporter ATP-binding protein [Candidatus Hydrogenedentota bacterium]